MFIIKFIDIKNKYLNNPKYQNYYTRSGRHYYEKLSDDFLIYYENDLIPNQQLHFDRLYITGIMPWYKYLELSLNERSTPNTTIVQDYDEQDHPFNNILKSLNKNGSEMRNDPSAANETGAESSEMRNDSRMYDLVQVLSEMKKRLDEKESSKKINIIILKSCRTIYNLSLKPENLFFFKNLPAVLQKKKESNEELMSQIMHKKNKLKGRTEEEKWEIFNSAADKFTANQKQLKSNFERSIENKLDSRGIGLAQEYDIFYEKICVNLRSYNLSYRATDMVHLYYYDDAKILADGLFKDFSTNSASEKEHNKTGLLIKIHDDPKENSRYIPELYELNYFNRWIPVRNQLGHFESVLISSGIKLETKTNENNAKLSSSSSFMNWMKEFSSSSFNFSPILLIRELEEKLFYIDKNQNTELYKKVNTTFYRLNFKPYEKFDLLKDEEFRNKIFREWENNLKINTPSNTVRDIYIEIMRVRFVFMSREGGKNITMRNLKFKYGLKELGENEKRNQPATQLSREKDRLKKIFKIFSPASGFKLFYCSTDFIKKELFNLDLNLKSTKSAFHYSYALGTRWADEKGIFLTPIEYCLINYAVLDGKIWSLSEIIKNSLDDLGSDLSYDVPDIKNPVIKHKLGFYNQFTVNVITNNLKNFCDFVNAQANLTNEKILKQSLKDYMELYYNIFVRDNLINGIQKYQNRSLNITNIKLFPGNFVFMLNYIQQNL